MAGENCGGFVDDVVIVVSFCCSMLLFDDELLVEDFRYCWITCNFSGSVTNHFYVATITNNMIERKQRRILFLIIEKIQRRLSDD